MIIKSEANNLYMYGTIWDGDERTFDNVFTQLEKKYNEVIVHLHTNGGNVFAGNFMIQRFQNSPVKIQMDVVGTAFSMGAIMLTAADKRRMVSNGFVMVHAPKGGVYGTATDFTNAAKLLNDMEAHFVESLARITSLPLAKVKKWMTGDNYFNAKEALRLGLIDEIIEPVTNTQIDDVKHMRPEDVYNHFAAVLTTTQKQTKNQIHMKAELIEMLGLQGVTAESSDTAIINAIRSHFEAQINALKEKLESEQKARRQLEEAIKAEEQAKIEALIAPLKGQITEDEEKALRNIAESTGIKALEIVISKMDKRTPIRRMIGKSKGVSDARENWTWDNWQAKDPRGLEKMAKEDPDRFLELGRAKYGENFKIN